MTSGLQVPAHLADRRRATDGALQRLQASFQTFELVEGRLPHVALYATGSLARREVGSRSDLDVFLIDTSGPDEVALKNLDKIELLADLIRAARAAGFGAFSADGEYLTVHRLAELLRFLGTRMDDSTNVFTARMLLLLESEPLVGRDAYCRAVDAVIDVYSRDAKGDEAFRPTFLVNDIVRYWKTLCLNYEAKRHDYHDAKARSRLAGDDSHDDQTSALKISLRVDLLKLRFNRLWTCFNALSFLLAGVEERSVSKERVRELIATKPVDRALAIARTVPDTEAALQAALDQYASFLEATDRPKADVEALFSSDSTYDEIKVGAATFAEAMNEVIRMLGQRSGVERWLLL